MKVVQSAKSWITCKTSFYQDKYLINVDFYNGSFTIEGTFTHENKGKALDLVKLVDDEFGGKQFFIWDLFYIIKNKVEDAGF